MVEFYHSSSSWIPLRWWVMHPESWFNALNASVAGEITTRRAALKWSLYRLATESGVSWGMVKAVETGKHQPRLDTFARIASALGTTPAEILASAQSRI